MRLVKSRVGDKYVLTFEISGSEAAAGGVDMHQLWQSKKLIEFIEALEKMTKPTDPLEDLRRRYSQKVNFNTNNPFSGFGATAGGRKYGADPNMGSFTREQLNEFMRRQAGNHFRGTGTAYGTTPNSEPEWAQTLGVKSTDSRDDIKARYRTLAKENHPDRGGDPVKFAKITEAYDQAMAVKP